MFNYIDRLILITKIFARKKRNFNRFNAVIYPFVPWLFKSYNGNEFSRSQQRSKEVRTCLTKYCKWNIHAFSCRPWFAPVIEGLLYVEDFTTNWFSRTWPYMEFICTCSSLVNWKIKLVWQRGLLHMSISVEATGKYYTYNLCSICG